MDEYLRLCEKRFLQIEAGETNKGESNNIYINELQAAFEGFNLVDEENANRVKSARTLKK